MRAERYDVRGRVPPRPLTAFALVIALLPRAGAEYVAVDVAPDLPSAGPAGVPAAAPGARACRGVRVRVASDLAAAVRVRPGGTTFCLERGIHRLRRPVVPKDGDKFVGEPGAVLSGARLLRAFVRRGPYWLVRPQWRRNPVTDGRCRSGLGRACTFANDVYVDDRPLRRVFELRALSPNAFFVDERTRAIVFALNPAGHRIELAVATRAFRGWRTGVDDVTVEGLVVEKFANEAGIGAINGRPSWKVVGNLVRLNHGGGIQDAGVIRGNVVRDNGQIGVLASYADGQHVVDNEIAFNNYAGYDPRWEAGGVKWVRSRQIVARRNRVHDNRGPGLWTDGSCVDVRLERNVVERNEGPGILHEIGYAAAITGNVVRRNGFGEAGWLDGAGIVVSSSRDVVISGNTVTRNRNGIGIIMTDRGPPSPGMPPHEVEDVSVQGNTIEMQVGETGLVQNVGDTSYFTSRRNRFARNRYVLGCRASYFSWLDPTGERAYAHLTEAQWVAAGNDADGHFTRRCPQRARLP